jgi:DNA-binding NarL/FixJ family response regulator
MLDVLLVEATAEERARVVDCLKGQAPLRLCAAVADGPALHAALAQERPQLLLVNGDAPGQPRRLACLRTLAPLGLPTLLYSQAPAELDLPTLLAYKVRGLIDKGHLATLPQALTAVAQGQLWFAPELLQRLYTAALTGPSSPLPVAAALTLREQQVLQLFWAAWSREQVARYLGISLNSVKTHLQHIRHKLGCHSLDELRIKAMPNAPAPIACG